MLAAPMIPALNDAELEKILQAAVAAGARHASYILLRLPLELKQMFEDWLQANYPDRAAHVLSLIRQCRDGKLNQAEFGKRMTGTGPYAQLLQQRFEKAVKRYGLDNERRPMNLLRFKVPTKQMDLF